MRLMDWEYLSFVASELCHSKEAVMVVLPDGTVRKVVKVVEVAGVLCLSVDEWLAQATVAAMLDPNVKPLFPS